MTTETEKFDITQHAHFIPSFAQLHYDVIEYDQVSMTFLPPLDLAKVERYWQEDAAETHLGKKRKTIFMEIMNDAEGKQTLVGLVVLAKLLTETGPFRAEMEKLLVSPKHRQQGIGKRLVQRLEAFAKSEGRTRLVIETSDALSCLLLNTDYG